MPVPKYDELMNLLLQALRELGGSGSISELEEAVARKLKLSDQDLNEIHRGTTTKFSYRLAWTRNYLKRYGLLENSSRGIWALTQKGLATPKIDKEEVKRFVRQQASEAAEQEEELPDIIESETISTTKSPQSWKEEVIDLLLDLSPSSFEKVCQRLLRESGFIEVTVTGRTGDGGIDGKGVVKVGGLLSFHAWFQAKKYKGTVSASVVRDFRGAMVGRGDKGLIITTGTFTRDAKAEAAREGAPPIDLIDGDELAEKLKSLNVGIEVERRTTEVVKINREWFRTI